MNQLLFEYFMKVKFQTPVKKHYFTLKCVPASTCRQEISELEVKILPSDCERYDVDAYGNRVITGQNKQPHDCFTVCVRGKAVLTGSQHEDESYSLQQHMYKYPSKYTHPGPALKAFHEKLTEEICIRVPIGNEYRMVMRQESAYKKAVRYMNRLYEHFVYEKGVTTTATTAEEAMALGRGVCQDYAHILLALLRMDQIPARYVVGMLTGIVDIYPALNPLGVDSITRGIPGFDLDMNRIFPGNSDGSMAEYVASAIVDDIAGSDVAIDIHASNIYLTEIPQVRINEITKDSLVPLAKYLNVDYIWVHSAATVLESTLAYSLNSIGTKTLVVEMGVGMRITQAYGNQLVDGILCLMKKLGIWKGKVIRPKKPIISTDGKVNFINTSASGIFVPAVEHWRDVREGEWLGNIINPLDTGYGNVKTAQKFGLPFVVIRKPKPYDTTTLNYNWQLWNSNAFSVYTHETDHIDKKSAALAVNSVLRFLENVNLPHL